MSDLLNSFSDTKSIHKYSKPSLIVDLFSFSDKIIYYILYSLWLAAFLYFWLWWFSKEHINNLFAFMLLTLMQGWLTLLPIYFLFILSRSKNVGLEASIPEKSRTAIVVTKAPSEPFPIVAQTLTAALKQDYPHDTWLADEQPTAEVENWCQENNIRISSRFGIKEYHRHSWPRRTRCKEGNLAFFYDKYGYSNYDFVVQMDADHVPTEHYLSEILKPFSNPNIGYVSAPSICDKNASKSWAARGRLFGEAVLHGAIQAGHSGGFAPLCIGSHYAVRTCALKEIGGLGAELAEDHSTTLAFNAGGWKGFHAIDAIAHGDGPETFYDLTIQEFQWSRSLTTILLTILPKLWKQLSPKLRVQFLFSELWYPLFSIFMFLSIVLPLAAIIFETIYANVTYYSYLAHFIPMTVVLTMIVIFVRKRQILRPYNAQLFSWELPVFIFSRWPWSFSGCLVAIYDFYTKNFVDFKVTSKFNNNVSELSIKLFIPYFSISSISGLTVWSHADIGKASGFYYFAILNTLIYSWICLLIFEMHRRENKLKMKFNLNTLIFFSLFGITNIIAFFAIFKNGSDGLAAILYGFPIPLNSGD